MKYLFKLLVIFLSINCYAQITTRLVSMSADRSLLVHYYVSEHSQNENIYILAPGVNRGFLKNDALLKKLKSRGLNFVAFHFSTQPHSIIQKSESSLFHHMDVNYKTSDYLAEFKFIIEWAKNKFNLVPIPVSLSFSGSVSSYLSDLDVVIDISPITSQRDAAAEVANYRDFLLQANMLNPYKDFIVRNAMDYTYSLEWLPKTKDFISKNNISENYKDIILEGYLHSSRSLETFKWTINDKIKKRIILIGQRESESLKKAQLKLVKSYLDKNIDITCFIVKNTGHAVPIESPSKTLMILSFINHNKLLNGCYGFNKDNKIVYLNKW